MNCRPFPIAAAMDVCQFRIVLKLAFEQLNTHNCIEKETENFSIHIPYRYLFSQMQILLSAQHQPLPQYPTASYQPPQESNPQPLQLESHDMTLLTLPVPPN